MRRYLSGFSVKHEAPSLEDMIPSERSLQHISEKTGIPLTELQEAYAVKKRRASEITNYCMLSCNSDVIAAASARKDMRRLSKEKQAA
ncbi:MAG: hypothetical protein WC254_06495 [Candidatus Woesearchaeota archaeon]|jgi:hypothetical protein